MDPPLISEASFSAANPASYSLAEIWPYSAGINGEMGSSSGLGLRIGNLGSRFGERDATVEESTVTEQSGGGGGGGGGGGRGNGRKRKDLSLEDETSNLVSTITSNGGNVLNDSSAKQSKIEQFDNENNNSKAGGSSSSENNKQAEQSCKPSEPPKQDYIHVRARRGQATDSHSLAERARREKISERMKLLQDLVPGCNKIIGKALVLDEIINYIQSLQRQVEFLSMKLETVDSRMSMNPMIEGFHPKDLGAQPFDATGMMFRSQATGEYAQGSQPEWLHMQVGGSFQRAT